MKAGSYGATDGGPHVASDAGWALAMVMAGAAIAAVAAVAALISGAGFIAALLVYMLGGSILVPALAVAPRALALVMPRRAPVARQAC